MFHRGANHPRLHRDALDQTGPLVYPAPPNSCHGHVGDALHHVSRRYVSEQRRGRRSRRRVASVIAPRRLIGDKPRGMQRARHVGDLPLDPLMVAQLASEVSAPDVIERVAQLACRAAAALGAPMRVRHPGTASRWRSLRPPGQQVRARHAAVLDVTSACCERDRR